MAEIDVLAGMWLEDLEDLTDQEVRQAVRMHRKQSTYFPTSAEIRNLCEQSRGMHSHGRNELPERPSQISEAERLRNKERAGKILRLLSGKKAVSEDKGR